MEFDSGEAALSSAGGGVEEARQAVVWVGEVTAWVRRRSR
jgi:hypothetical protein